MELTRAADYALRGVLYLSLQPEGTLSVISEIAEQMDIPEGFLARIFQTLAKSGIIRSHRGKKGGFSLALPAEEINMRKVIETMEGPIHLNRCLNGYGDCGRGTLCSLHDVWCRIQEQVITTLGETTFSYLAQQTKNKMQEHPPAESSS
ncbi:MAG: Rrf2 family transcriptional regulator [Deltaproteobacteria bacterium]|nr:Rrf2 family transcriptional regulator [Deltaproteobacteria bacterium]